MITISNTRHTRKQGSNVRIVGWETVDEGLAVHSTNITTQGIGDLKARVIGWGDWKKFKSTLTNLNYEVQGE